MKIIQADLEQLVMLVQLFDKYRIFYQQTSDIQAATQFLKARIENKESVIFMAQMPTGQFAGFVQLYPIFSSMSMKRSWLLNDLYVDVAFRRQGVGEALINAAKQLCYTTAAKGLLLETEKDNTTAQALYLKTGFIRESNFFYFWKSM